MLQHFQIRVSSELKPTEGNTPVTTADKVIDKMVVEAGGSVTDLLGNEQR